ncbi:MAG: hemerythrin domain-containing protein [Deltaproteobacteria bacterium]|nr:hemerythrin domain-containing protein [Deltaproteobacteria bacterium]
MSKHKLEIKYRCTQGTCCANCREGVLAFDEAVYDELKAAYDDPELFRSPKGYCKLGFSRPFKVREIVRLAPDGAEAEEQWLDENDPIGTLILEHKQILKIFDEIEAQIKRRDIKALWVSTYELANAIHLHSGLKEEEVLFPAMRDVLAFGESLTAIIKEEHREIMSLLSNFRSALEEETILDSIITSMIVSLKGHIRKENQEFFEMVDKCLDRNMRMEIADGMKKIEAEFKPTPITVMQRRVNEERGAFDDEIIALRELTHQGCCH